MRISEIRRLLNARVLTSSIFNDTDILYVFASDMMSDVLAYADKRMILVTSLTNPQVIRTAEMMDINCILYVRGKVPSDIVIAMAEERHITMLAINYCMFDTCGILYDAGLRGGKVYASNK